MKVEEFHEKTSLREGGGPGIMKCMEWQNPIVLLEDIGNTGNVKKEGKMVISSCGWGQGCAQQHRREAVDKEEKRFHPSKNKSATPLQKSKHLGDLTNGRQILMWDLEIRHAHASMLKVKSLWHRGP